ncbi:MAG: helicase HerA domain-containing protein, partial [Candidatus Methanofastidiosia archaeon]
MKHSSEKVVVDEELSLLGEDEVFCGRKKSIYESYKDKASMFIGSVAESNLEGEDYFGRKVLVDSISPHAIFICGMRGSGKSYTLGVLAEEIALKNDAVGTIIIDPMGIFWSMKKENSIEIERKILEKWSLKPRGIKNIVVFCPLGHTKKAPRETWDRIFTIKPSELTAEDWCLTFGFDRFDTLGLLVDRVCEKVRKGYTTSSGKFIDGRGEEYSISDMIECISSEEGVVSKTKGFKESTRRALIARLKGAIDWGIFDVSGTEL